MGQEKGVDVAKEPAKPRKQRKDAVPKVENAKSESAKADDVQDAVVLEEQNNKSKSDAPPKVAKNVTAKDPESKAEQAANTEPKPIETKVSEPVPTQPSRDGVFLPMLLGGLLAGAIGYGVAYLQYADEAVTEPAATANDIADLRAEIAALPGPTDTSDLSNKVTDLSDAAARIDEEIAALAERVETVERQPSGDGTLPQTAIDAFEADMLALRDQVAAQQSELAAVADQTAARLATTRAEAEAIEQNAIEAARAATAKASLARVQGALESGAPFGGLLGELESALGEPAPDALSAVVDGTATLGSLQSEFPVAARRALADARSEGVDGDEASGFTAFLRDQLDMRSVAPKEGASVDATLSRAEAALREGRLNDALAEIGTLPDVARAAMSDWLALAEARASAIDAADTLSNSLSDN